MKPKTIKFVKCPECDEKVEGKKLGQHIGCDHAEIAWRIYAQVYLEKMWFAKTIWTRPSSRNSRQA